MRVIGALGVLALPFLNACAVGDARTEGVDAKLARVGLRRVAEREARVPRKEHGRFVPCTVVGGASSSPLKPHSAGYLIVGVDRREFESAAEILAVLAAWSPGESLTLWVRRNPYLSEDNDWWEGDVRVILPAAPRE